MDDLNEIKQSLDALRQEVAALSQEIQALREHSPSKQPAGMVVVDGLESSQTNLTGLVEKVGQRAPQIETIVDQLEALTDLVAVIQPILKQGFDLVVEQGGKLEEKGYFAVTRTAGRTLDATISSLSGEDLAKIEESAVPLLALIRQLTDPLVLEKVNTTLTLAKDELSKPAGAGWMDVNRAMNDPDTRRGLVMMLHGLKAVGQQAAVSK